MERTTNPTGVIRWKKIGGGGFYFRNHIIKPGQIFTARPEDIPKAFRDTVIPLDEIVEVPEVPVVVTKTTYTKQPRGKSKLWFDVIDDKGKVLNEKALKEDVADQLINDLNR